MNKKFFAILVSVFTICGIIMMAGPTSAKISEIHITAPTGGALWSGEQNITWSTTPIDDPETVNIYYSTDNFVSQSVSIVSGKTNDGTYTWNTEGLTDGNNYKIKIRSSSDPDVFSVSSAFSLDNTHPTVTISSDATNPTKTSPIPITVTFSEPVTGFDLTDVTVGNGAKGNFNAVSSTEYTFDVTPASDGLVTVDIAADKATDLAGNGNEAAQFSITYDSTAPTVIISSTASDPTKTRPIPIKVIFSEPVTGFDLTDVTVGNGTAGNFNTASSTEYTFNVTPTGNDPVTVDVTVDIAADKATDLAGNGNAAAAQFSITYDSTAPGDPTVSDPLGAITVNADTYTIKGTAEADSLVKIYEGGSVVGSLQLTAGTTTYAISVPLNQNSVNNFTVTATDGAGNESEHVDVPAITEDSTAPTVTISSTATNPTKTSPIPITVTFSEPVTGFDLIDVTVDNGTAGNLTGSGANYTFTVTPASDGAVTVDIDAGVAIDAAGNGNTAVAPFSITYDSTAPTIDITSPMGGETWIGGTTQTISWTANDAGNFGASPITIEYAINGSGLMPIANSSQPTGSYSWTIPQLDGGAQITITAVDQAGNSASKTTGGFSIKSDMESGQMWVNTPSNANGRNILKGGSTTTIIWGANDKDCGSDKTVDIYYTVDGGDTMSPIAISTPNSGIYNWTVPLINSNNAIIKIIATDDSGNITSGISSPFVIDSTKPEVEIDVNNDTLQEGQRIKIFALFNEDTANNSSVFISLSIDGTLIDRGAMWTNNGKLYNYEYDIPKGIIGKVDAVISGAEDLAGNAMDILTSPDLFEIVEPGTPQPPAIPTSTTSASISLVQGWNLISLPLIPENSAIETIISGIKNNVGTILSYDSATNDFLRYTTSSAEFTTMVDGKGYWVYMENPDSLTITGYQMREGTVPPSYPLTYGWNLIGLKSLTNESDSDYLKSVGSDNYVVLWRYDTSNHQYVNVKGVSAGMKVGNGFWLWLNSERNNIVPTK